MFSGMLSLVGVIVVTLATRPTSRIVLQAFYRKTRLFGWWKPIRGEFASAALTAADAESRRDSLSTVFATGWQLSLFLMGMSAMMKQWDQLGRVDRLDPRKPSKTVIAGGVKGGGRSHLHPEVPRTLSVRECARLQSFPDDFVFLGSTARQFTQVGNSVPPILAAQIARAVWDVLSDG